MKDATPVGRDAPRDLWIAKPIYGGEGGKAEWADLDCLPWLDNAGSEVAHLKRRFGFLDQGNLGFAAVASLRSQDNSRRGECAAKGINVRLITVQVGEQSATAVAGMGEGGISSAGELPPWSREKSSTKSTTAVCPAASTSSPAQAKRRTSIAR